MVLRMLGRPIRRDFTRLLLGAAIAILALVAFAAPMPARAQTKLVSVRLAPVGGSSVSGVMAFEGLTPDNAFFALAAVGLEPGQLYSVQLHGGTCDQPGASFARIAALLGDTSGADAASGIAVSGSGDNIPLNAIADGAHAIIVSTGGQPVACGVIPLLGG